MANNKKGERIGQVRINHDGLKMTCIDYIDNHHIVVKFDDEDNTTINTSWRSFDNKCINLNKLKRLGEERYNSQGCLMKIIEYNSCDDITVEFQDDYKYKVKTKYLSFVNGTVENSQQALKVGVKSVNKLGQELICIEYIDYKHVVVEIQDEYKTKVTTTWHYFSIGKVYRKIDYKFEREGTEVYNQQNCLMKCVEYNNSADIIVEFQDEYKYRIRTNWGNFYEKKSILNPFAKDIYDMGIKGIKYQTHINGNITKEYQCWCDMLYRCSEGFKKDYPTYKDCTCCEEWLYFPNFYEWLHTQENFEKWLNGDRWCLDKDILYRHNKLYSPQTCCLVPNNVNTLFVKKDANRGELPIGVTYNHKRYMANYSNPITGNTREYIGTYDTPLEAYYAYKKEKEKLIKKIAQIEYDKNNIITKCYKAMLKYEVEITD